MIKKVYRSGRDLFNLSNKRVDILAPKESFDYKGLVVNKPWGYEYLLFENDFVAIWILHLKFNESTSLHCHPQKKTSLIVLSGEVHVSTLSDNFVFKQREGLIIDKGVFHSSKAISPAGLFLMEIETPPNKTDLVRLKDEYGRQGKGYENVQQMTRELSAYEYCDFHDLPLNGKCCKDYNFLGGSIKIVRGLIQDIVEYHLKNLEHPTICLLENNMIDINNIIVLETGEATEKELLFSRFGDVSREREYTIMIIN